MGGNKLDRKHDEVNVTKEISRRNLPSDSATTAVAASRWTAIRNRRLATIFHHVTLIIFIIIIIIIGRTAAATAAAA